MGEVVPIQEQVIVVIGASAGGIEALERLAGALPSNFPAPVVVAQHLDPTHESRLDVILRQRAQMRVVSVTKPTPLADGTLYVIPAGEDVEISGDLVSVTQRGRGQTPVPSIDTLFKSAAQAFGDRAIAVVLSGTGSDGPLGVMAIKEAGGMVVVQDPLTAAFPALPASIPPVNVDLVCDIEVLGPLLSSLVADGDPSARTLDDEMLRAFLLQLRARSGIDFTQYKTPTIKRRLSRLMAASKCATLADYMRYLNSHPEAYYRLVSSFLIKVTGFFRDPAVYKYLREQVLPEIIQHARSTRSELRLWSAGCATGEEAYSLAILLSELLGEELDQLDIRIFATDLDAESIAFARRGVYPSAALSEMPPDLLQKYFIKIDEAYQVNKRIRNLTVFGEYDLGQRAPFPRIDLVFCRNVLIYFTKELQQRTLQLFAFSLREGGYLVLGKAETTSPLPQHFTCVNQTLKIFRRQGERLLIPAPAFGESPVQDRLPARRAAVRSFTPARRAVESTPRWSINERLGTVLFGSEIGMVLVDHNYDIQTINQAARQLLGIHGQGVGEDLIHLASGVPAADLKSALDDALRGGKCAPREVECIDAALGSTRFIELSCYPERSSSKDAEVSGAMLLLEDITDKAVRLRKFEKEMTENRAQLARVSKQNEDLMERQRSLTEANKELTAANAELRSTNEHLLIAAEEAEASAEEVETLNEEMQATTEELETLNEELQATVEELNTTNEELGARSRELEQAAKQRQTEYEQSERERRVFENVLEKAPMIGAVLDGAGTIRNATELYVQHAAANAGKLPAVGRSWKEIPNSVSLSFDGANVHYRVSVVTLPGGSGEKLVVLSG
jgi:two-component system, chemotaxis family, CheB/CheR fusion protein